MKDRRMSEKADRILVAGCEEHILELLELYLSKDGFIVAGAADGAGTLEMIEELEPDLAVLDAGGGNGSGLETLGAIRERSDMPVIVLVTYGAIDQRDAAFELGADDVVVTPFRPRDMVSRVHTILRRSHMNLRKEIV